MDNKENVLWQQSSFSEWGPKSTPNLAKVNLRVFYTPFKRYRTTDTSAPYLSASQINTKLGGFIYLFGVLCRFQHCTGHITTGSYVGRGNQYMQLVKVLHCKLPTIGKQLPTSPHEVQGLNRRSQRWEVSVLPKLSESQPLEFSTSFSRDMVIRRHHLSVLQPLPRTR